MIERKGKYIPDNEYNQIKEIFMKNCKAKSLLVLYSSEYITTFTNHGISERNMKCDSCITEIWNDMSKINWDIERTTYFSESPKQNWQLT